MDHQSQVFEGMLQQSHSALQTKAGMQALQDVQRSVLLMMNEIIQK